MCHQLKTLDLSKNLICQAENYRHIIIGLLPNLSLLDNVRCVDSNTNGSTSNLYNSSNSRRNSIKSLSKQGSDSPDMDKVSSTMLTYDMIAEANGDLLLMNEALEDEARLESGLFSHSVTHTAAYDAAAVHNNDTGKYSSALSYHK